MKYKIEEIEGIGPSYGEKLVAVNISTTTRLLDQCATPKGRKDLATQTGISEKMLLKWANLADLMRISGVGKQFSELLEAAGVDTVKELRNRRADSLAQKMSQVNGEKKLTRSVPSEKMVGMWVEQAKQLDPKITY